MLDAAIRQFQSRTVRNKSGNRLKALRAVAMLVVALSAVSDLQAQGNPAYGRIYEMDGVPSQITTNTLISTPARFRMGRIQV